MRTPLFHRALGAALADLAPPIVTIHDIGDGITWHGTARVEAGTSPLGRLIGAVAAFPPTAESVPLTVNMTPHGDGEIWARKFGNTPLSSYLGPGPEPRTIEETMSGVTVCSQLVPEDGGLRHVPIGVYLLGIPLPKLFWPTLDVRETADGSTYKFKVVIRFWNRLLLRYDGYLETQAHHDIQ